MNVRFKSFASPLGTVTSALLASVLTMALEPHASAQGAAPAAGHKAPAAISQAQGVTLLDQWVRETHNAQSDFTQTVVDERKKSGTASSGSFAFERPGKFRWIYTKPYRQDIVSDGTTIWTYDHDLDQVTVSKQSQALSGTPALLLAGGDVEKLFTLTPLPSVGGLQWVRAVPRGTDNSFDWVRIGLRPTPQGPELVEMQLRDAFRRTSIIVFSNIRRNQGFPAGSFHFKAPQGASVIQQP